MLPQQSEVKVKLDAALARELTRAIAELRFGSIELTIHEGRIVQIERREKIRLTEKPPDRP